MTEMESEYIINTIEFLIVHIRGLDEKDRENQADALKWLQKLRVRK